MIRGVGLAQPSKPRRGLFGAIALVLSLAGYLPSCSRTAERSSAARVAAPAPFPEPAPRGRDANDVARFLAGLPAVSGSPFANLEAQPIWEEHRDKLDLDWDRIQSKAIPAMRQFQLEEFGTTAIGRSVVFYPFSGPDALMVTVFFPQSPVYVMVGLEPPGSLPILKQLEHRDLGLHLQGLRAAVHSEIYRSFFITREMDRQFRGQVSDGLLPAILHLLVRAGHTVTGYRYVRIDATGQVVERRVERGKPAAKTIRGDGVEVDFQTGDGLSAHRLFYFSINLSDSRLGKDDGFLTFLSRLSGVTTYLKATSYMLHHAEFSVIRRLILSQSAAILQDDSGIPYRFFDPARWRVQLYGGYERPYGSFRWLEQPDLRKAYGTLNPKPLHFRIGYGFSRIPSNLQLATAKEIPANLRAGK